MSKTTYPGIDYSHGLPMANGCIPNIDSETDIRYGVISQHDVDYWLEASEPDYPCEECEHDIGSDDCGMCECEPIGFSLDDGEYQAGSCLDTDVMIYKSPFFTYAQFCSPCVPGACNLNSPLVEPLESNKCYCFGPDCFYDDEHPCPYPIWRVDTGEQVYKPAEEANECS